MKEELGLNSYLDMLNRRFGIFLTIFIAFATLLFIGGETARPVFQSQTTILVNRTGVTNPELIFSPGAGGFSARPNLANHIEILKSRALARRVLDTLPDDLRAELSRRAGPDPVAHLVSSISVRAVRDADILKLSIIAPTSELARALARAYVDAYESWTLERTRADIRAVREFVSAQLKGTSTRLDSLEQELEISKRAAGNPDLSAQSKALIERQSAVLSYAERTAAELAGLKKELELLTAQPGQGMANGEWRTANGAPSPVSDISIPIVAALSEQLIRLETERTNLFIQGYDTTSPRASELTRRIGEIKTRLANAMSAGLGQVPLASGNDPKAGGPEVDFPSAVVFSLPEKLARIAQVTTEIVRLEAQNRVLKRAIENYESEIARLPAEERAIARLTRNVEVARQVHSLLELKFEEARIQEAGRLSPIALIDPPGPGRKIRPAHLKNGVAALVLGLLMALGSTLLVDRLDTLVRSPEDIERRGWTLIGSIPRLPSGSTLICPETGVPEAPKAHYLPESVTEQFRILRTNLQFISAEKKTCTIVVSSPSPAEGKSTIAANLALVLARAGKKTLLVDCDLRKPILHKKFSRPRKPGITDCVLLGAPLEKTLFRPAPDGPDIIFAGTTPPSPVDFFTSSAFLAFLERLPQTYEYIIIDTPPVLVSADAVAIAARSDGIILVTRMNRTDLRALGEARKLLEQAQVRILGVVANGINPARRYGYYRYKYRYYHYRYASLAPESTPDSAV